MNQPTLSLIVIKTDRMQSALPFYRCLGFEFTEERHGEGPLHYSASLGEAVMEIYPLPEGQPVDSTTRLGFKVNNLQEAVERVEATDGQLVKPPCETAWGLMALVKDSDGRTVELYER